MRAFFFMAVFLLLGGCVVGGALIGGENHNASASLAVKQQRDNPVVFCNNTTGDKTRYCARTSEEQVRRMQESLNKYREYSRF